MKYRSMIKNYRSDAKKAIARANSNKTAAHPKPIFWSVAAVNLQR
jgi:hypothetical protein